MKPKELVAWTLAITFALFMGLAGMALTHDVLISDFPRLRALLSIDGQLTKMVAVVGISAAPATLLVFMFGGSRSDIEFSILGIKVKGVAAPPVLWTLVFLCAAAVLTIGIELVAWTLAITFALFMGLAGMALTHDVLISDFPRLRALLSIDGQLTKMVAVVGISAAPATLLVFMFGGSRSDIEFSILGIKVKGVAAPPVLWTLVFLCAAAVLTIGMRVAGQW